MLQTRSLSGPCLVQRRSSGARSRTVVFDGNVVICLVRLVIEPELSVTSKELLWPVLVWGIAWRTRRVCNATWAILAILGGRQCWGWARCCLSIVAPDAMTVARRTPSWVVRANFVAGTATALFLSVRHPFPFVHAQVSWCHH